MYLDYAKTHGNGEQPVAETEGGTTTIVSNHSKTDYDVYGARGQLTLQLSSGHTLTAGAEYGFVKGGGTVTSDAKTVSPADYGNRENTVSLFAECVGSIGK